MKVKLIHHTFPDDPTWTIVDESVPLGTIYEVIGYVSEGMTIKDIPTNRIKPVECYLVVGNGSRGYLPTVCFEAIES